MIDNIRFFESQNMKADEAYYIYLKKVNGIHFDNTLGIQIIYVIDGEISVSIAGEEIRAGEGELVIINKYESRFIYSKDLDNLCLIMNVDEDYIYSLNDSYTNTKFFNYISQGYVNEFILNNLAIIYKMRLVESDREVRYRQLNQFLKILLKYYSLEREGERNYPDYIEGIRELIDRNEIDKLHLRYLSEYFGLSKSYISINFAEEMGIKFTEFIQQLKLYIGTIYTLNTNENFELIAELMEFESTKSLNRIFNRYLEMTPSQFRKKFKLNKTISRDSENYRALFKRVESINYGAFIEEKMGPDFRYSLSAEAEGKDMYRTWTVIRDLKSLGVEYLNHLGEVVEDIDVKEIILNFELDEERDVVILSDFDRKISMNELYSLLNKCINYELRAIISLGLEDIDPENDSYEDVEARILSYKKFYDTISTAIGTTNMKKFSYLIDISNIASYSENPEALRKYKRYIQAQKGILEEKFETDEYDWGFELGFIDDEKIDALRDIYLSMSDSSLIPRFASVSYSPDKFKTIKSIEDIENIERYIEKTVRKVDENKASLDFITNRIYVRDLFQYLDISDVDYKYRDLFIMSLAMKSSFLFKNEISYVSDFKVTDKNEDDGFFYPQMIDNYGFPTPIYWSAYLLDQVRGKVIHNQSGCVATSHGDDLYLVVYGDIILDYLYASKKGYYKLFEDNYKLKVDIKGLKGKYKVITQKLSYENGTINYNLGDLENYKYLSLDEREYIKRVSLPSLKINIMDIEGDFTDVVDYSPFNLVVRKYIKI